MTDGNVQASYTAGYMGAFVTGAAVGAIVASGTGYYYPPYVYHGYYYPYAATYGYHTYNPYTGAYGYEHSAYGPYGSAHWGASYNPNTGTYARGATTSTAYGKQAVGAGLQPVHRGLGRDPPGLKCVRILGTIRGQQEWQHGIHPACQQCVWFRGNGADFAGRQRRSAPARPTATPPPGKTSNGDMYAGHDGNVYKNTGSGWQTYNNGSWNDVNKHRRRSNRHRATSSNIRPAVTSSYSSAQQKAQSNPNYASAQQKAQSNPNYSADQQKAQSYSQQHPSK